MRVLILSQYFAPEPISKPVDLAHALMREQDEVFVVTGFPNYPSGKLYPGYRLRPVKRESCDGVAVVRTFEFPYHGKSFFGRVLNYVSFMLSAPFGALLAPKADVMYVWHPPLTIGVAAWIISRMKGIPIVYDVQDLWPESAVLAGLLRPGFGVWVLSVLERFVYRKADHLIVVTEGARRVVASRGVPQDKVSVMPHWIDTEPYTNIGPDTRAIIRERHGWSGRFVLLFAGNLGIVQGLETILQAACLIRDRPEILFVFIGDGADRERLQELAEELQLERSVQFIDRQPAKVMPEFMAAADTLIVHLKASPLSSLAIPAKTAAYLASGTPVIFAVEGETARLVELSGAGLSIPSSNPEALADAVRNCVEMSPEARAALGLRGPSFVAMHLAMDVVIPRYRSLLEKVASDFRRRR
jgi:colanic acid biosynthesis glycosyl transferase WcaI